MIVISVGGGCIGVSVDIDAGVARSETCAMAHGGGPKPAGHMSMLALLAVTEEEWKVIKQTGDDAWERFHTIATDHFKEPDETVYCGACDVALVDGNCPTCEGDRKA